MAAAVKMPAVFGEAQPDDDHEEQPRRPVLFRAHAQGLLRVVATDLHSLAWNRSLPSPTSTTSGRIRSKMMLASLAPAPTSSTTSIRPCRLATSSSSTLPPVLIVLSLWLQRQRVYLASLSHSIQLLPRRLAMS